MPPLNQYEAPLEGTTPVQLTTLKGVGGRVLDVGGIMPPIFYRPVTMPPNAGGSIMGKGFMALPPGTTMADLGLSSTATPAVASYDTQSTAAPSSPQWSNGAILQSLNSTSTTGASTVKWRALVILGFLLLLAGAFGQSDNSIHVKEFAGNDVGRKVANAMTTCPAGNAPCILIVDASLATYPAGTMPTLCGNCSLIDYRNGAAALTNSTKLSAPIIGNSYYISSFPNVTPKGAWAAGTYGECQAVTYSGQAYISAASGNTSTPGAGTQWVPVAQIPPVASDPIDCADAVALAYMAAQGNNGVDPHFVLDSGIYYTCAGVQQATTAGGTHRSISITGSGQGGSWVYQDPACPALTTHGTVWLPEQAAQGGPAPYLSHFNIDAGFLAPYALDERGAHADGHFDHLKMTDGAISDYIFGDDSAGNAGWVFQDAFDSLSTSTRKCPITGGCGTGATGTVSVSGGVPSITVTNGTSTTGGTQFDSHTIAWLEGAQGGASEEPCATMGAEMTVGNGGLTINGSGVITAITPSAYSGCVAPVYLFVIDGDGTQYCGDFNYVTDSTMVGLVNAANCSEASVRFKHGNNTIVSNHSESYMTHYGIENASSNRFLGTDFGESPVEVHITGGNSQFISSNYFSSVAYPFAALFRVENNGASVSARDLSCSGTQGGEFWTIINAGGAFARSNSNIKMPLGNVAYCGPGGSGSTINVSPAPLLQTANAVSATGGNNSFNLGTWQGIAGATLTIDVYGSAGSTSGSQSAGWGRIVIVGGNNSAAPNLAGESVRLYGNTSFISGVSIAATSGSTSTSNSSWDVWLTLNTNTIAYYIATPGNGTTWTASGTAGTVPVGSYVVASSLVRDGVTPMFITLSSLATITGTATFSQTPALSQVVVLGSATLTLTTAPVGCSTYAVVNLWDVTSASSLANVTLASGTSSYPMTVTAQPAKNDVLALRVNGAPSGCSTNATNPVLVAEYSMQ